MNDLYLWIGSWKKGLPASDHKFQKREFSDKQSDLSSTAGLELGRPSAGSPEVSHPLSDPPPDQQPSTPVIHPRPWETSRDT